MIVAKNKAGTTGLRSTFPTAPFAAMHEAVPLGRTRSKPLAMNNKTRETGGQQRGK